MNSTIDSGTALEAWKKSILLALDKEKITTRKRPFREIENFVVKIRDGSDYEKALDILEKITPWEYPDIEDIKTLLFTKNKPSIVSYSYGERIHNYEGLNQLEEHVIPLLRKVEKTRRAVISIINPKRDLYPDNRAIPGLLNIQFKINENKELDIYLLMRGMDIFLGLPFNIAMARLLQEHVARKTNTKPGSISIYSTTAQLYCDYEEYIEEMLKII